MYLSLLSWTLVDSSLLLVAFWWKFRGFLNGLSCHVLLQLRCTADSLKKSGSDLSSPQSAAFFLSREQAGTASSSGVGLRFPLALVSVPSSLLPVKGSYLLYVRPQKWGAQYVAQTTCSLGRISTHASSLFHWIPSHQNSSWFNHFSSYLPDSLWIFLAALAVQESFCQVPAKFQWKLSHV